MNQYDESKMGGVSVKEDPEITRWLRTLGERIDHLTKVIDVLEKHLTPILTPQPNAPQNVEKAQEMPIISPLADNLREFDRRIRVVTDILEHTDIRLEI